MSIFTGTINLNMILVEKSMWCHEILFQIEFFLQIEAFLKSKLEKIQTFGNLLF